MIYRPDVEHPEENIGFLTSIERVSITSAGRMIDPDMDT